MNFHWNLNRPAASLALAAMLISAGNLRAQGVLAAPEPPEPFVFALRGGMAGQSFLGVSVAEVNGSRARELKLKEERGVEVTRIEDQSAAAKAGVKPGDAVLEFNGQRVEGLEQFSRLVRETPAGREVKLLISRGGVTQTVAVVMGARKAAPMLAGRDVWLNMPEINIPEMPRVFANWSGSMLGIEAESLGSQLGEFFGVKEGVLVRSVAKGSAAEKAGLKAGDVVAKVDQTAVTSPSDIASAIRSARSKGTVPVSVVRNKQEIILTVALDDELPGTSLAPRVRARGVKR